MSIIVEMTSDPGLVNNFLDRLSEDVFDVPLDYLKTLKSIRGLKSTKPGRLINRASSPEDYQTQLTMLSQVQSLQDQVYEIQVNLRVLEANWSELRTLATDYLYKKFYEQLMALKNETSRTAVVEASLRPIEAGLEHIQMLQELADGSIKHLDRTCWNLKEANSLLVEYLKPLKFSSSKTASV